MNEHSTLNAINCLKNIRFPAEKEKRTPIPRKSVCKTLDKALTFTYYLIKYGNNMQFEDKAFLLIAIQNIFF